MRIVSVIIPTYKHEKHVLETLESVFRQTCKEYEIIVVNDGSPDNTGDVLKPLAASGRIRYIEQKNAGQAAARNRGLAEAKGEYVAFLDDDDLWPADKLEWQVEVLEERSELAAVAGQAAYFWHHPAEGDAAFPGIAESQPVTFSDLFDGNPMVSPGQTLIRKSALLKVKGFSEDIWGAEDLDLWIRLSQIGSMELRPKIALHYRVHPANASNNRDRMFKNSLAVINRQLADLPPGDRAGLSRRAMRWLYGYIGVQWLAEFKRDARSGSISGAMKAAIRLWQFAVPMIKDRELRRRICRDAVFSRRVPSESQFINCK